MPEPVRTSSKSVWRPRIKAAALAAGLVAVLCGVAAVLPSHAGSDARRVGLLDSFLVAGMVFIALFPMFLFVFLLMQSGIEWLKRGGKPTPFAGDS